MLTYGMQRPSSAGSTKAKGGIAQEVAEKELYLKYLFLRQEE